MPEILERVDRLLGDGTVSLDPAEGVLGRPPRVVCAFRAGRFSRPPSSSSASASAASAQPHRAGRIAAGYQADLTVFAEDPVTTSAADLADVPIELTIVDGTLRHARAAITSQLVGDPTGPAHLGPLKPETAPATAPAGRRDSTPYSPSGMIDRIHDRERNSDRTGGASLMGGGRAGAMTEAEITAAVAAQTEWMVGVLERLVAAPTVLGSEEAGQAVMEQALRDVGLAPRDVWLDADALRADPGSSPFSWDVSAKRNVVATWEAGADGGRSLILNGHVDVVPPAAPELWSSPPFVPHRRGDWLYGRGAGDMKAGLVAILGAVRGLRSLGVAPCADVHVQSVVEEECTGNGALQCLLSGPAADGCVIAEPHPDYITTSQVGVLWAHVDIVGRPGHAAVASDAGFNAIDAASTVSLALRELEAEMNAVKPPPFDGFAHPINLNPGVIHGGDWTSTVAAQCTVSYRLGLYPGQSPAEVAARVEAVVAATAAANPFLAENPPRVRYDGFRCEGFTLPPNEPVAVTLADAYHRVVGTQAPLVATTATTDARHFVRRGIPAVCFGPLAEEIHGIDERVSIASMERAAQVLAVFASDWCGLVSE